MQHLKIGFAFVAAFMATTIATACTPAAQKEGAKTAIDVSGAVCEELDASLQDEPAWLKFTCSIIETGGAVSKPFLAKVKRDDPTAIAAARARTAKCPTCPACAPGTVHPGTVAP